MTVTPTDEQHRALLNDCRTLAAALEESEVRDRGGKQYIPRRFKRRVEELADDPTGLFEYIRGMANRTSEGLSAIVKYGRIDMSVEQAIILAEDRPYSPLFSDEDRALAQAKVDTYQRQLADLQVEHEQELDTLASEREKLLDEEDRAMILSMNQRRVANGRAVMSSEQEAIVLENRRARR